jgi:acetate kinase
MTQWLLVVNVGSTSVKTQLFDGLLRTRAALAADYGDPAAVMLTGLDWQGGAVATLLGPLPDVAAVLAAVLARWQTWLDAAGVRLSAIGHRIVHGADWFGTLTPISPDVLARLAALDAYAPLHNPFNRLGVGQTLAMFPQVAHFALFDTGFHRQLPMVAKRYAIPEALSTTVAFYRYGFHGLSCQHSLNTAAHWLGRAPAELNLIILHLGGGASATAVRGGVSVDTSMGFSPTAGLMMAGRCGDLDPMIVLTLQQQGLPPAQLSGILNHESGLHAVCGEGDMRRILHRADAGDAAAALAAAMFCYQLKKYIGAYCAVLGEVSAVVFTGGIGEHAAAIRAQTLEGLGPLGFALDPAANQVLVGGGDISAADSRARVLVIPAEEAQVCAGLMLGALAA